MFDLEESKYPSSWKEMALDFKLMYAFSGGMMVLGMVGSALSIQWQLGMVGALLLVLASVAIRHRMKADWHWPGVGIRGAVGALMGGAIGIFFFGAAAMRISPLDPKWFPWFAFGGGIILFGVLAGLRLVAPAESDFQCCCGEQILSEPFGMDAKRSGPPWKRAVRGAFAMLGMVVWLVGVGYFWQLNVAVRDAPAQPTPPKTELLEGHWLQNRDQLVYVTPAEKSTIILLEQMAMYGLLTVVVIGLALQFLVKPNQSDEGLRPADQLTETKR